MQWFAGRGDTAGALLASAREALVQAMAEAPDGTVVALGVISMGESGVLLDGHGASLAPVITWQLAGRKAMASDG